MLIHVVKKGESLWQIAKYYGADINRIIDINNLVNPNVLLEGQALIIPKMFKQPKKSIEVNAFINAYEMNDDFALGDSIDYLTYLTPLTYSVQKSGTILPIFDEQVIQYAISNNVIPVMSLSNLAFGVIVEDTMHYILNDINLSKALLENIVSTMKEKNYRGLNVYFENILPSDKEAYNNFLQHLKSRLHAEGLFISSILAPKASEEQSDVLAHDYQAHGRIVDYVIIMPFLSRRTQAPPGPISPVDEIKNVLKYVLTVIPSDKIFLSFPFYAKDWTLPYVKGREASTISIQEAMNKAYKYRVKIMFGEKSQTPYFNYIDEEKRFHEVWFDDVRSVIAKFNVVKVNNLRGLSYWTLDYPFPQNWWLLQENFDIIKQ